MHQQQATMEHQNHSDHQLLFTADEVSDIVEDSVRAAMDTFERRFTELVHNKISALDANLTSLEDDLNRLKLTHDSEIDGLKKKVGELEDHIKANTKYTIHALHLANSVEQYTRKSSLRIYCLQLDREMPCKQQVSEFLSSN